MIHVVHVPLGARSYDVVVGSGAVDRLPELVPAGARRAAVITQHGGPAAVDPGIPHEVFTIAEGEEAKSLATVERPLLASWPGGA